MSIFKRKKKPQRYPEFQENWRKTLNAEVRFYQKLKSEQRANFEERCLLFLNTTKITGIKTVVEDEDRILIASGAIIPIFAFPNWQYYKLNEVLLYPDHFDEDFKIGSNSKGIVGMVGYGYMNGTMILAKDSLRHGFRSPKDGDNTAIHEFVHLLDKADGGIDGILGAMNKKEHLLPWLHFMDLQIQEIREGNSDIRAYGGTNRSEFLAVASEFFFERPEEMEKEHPVLYEYMETMFGLENEDKTSDNQEMNSLRKN